MTRSVVRIKQSKSLETEFLAPVQRARAPKFCSNVRRAISPHARGLYQIEPGYITFYRMSRGRVLANHELCIIGEV